MYADWNECLKHVDTEYFYFLTSDDTCFPELVSTTVNALDAYPDVDVCHFQFCLINEAGRVVQSFESITQQQCALYCEVNQYPHLRSGICEFMMHFAYRAIYTTITSLVFRRKLLKNLQGFNTTYGSIGDYDWTMRMGLFTDVLYIPKLLATWRTYNEQATKLTTRLKRAEQLLDVAEGNLALILQVNQSKNLKEITSQYLLSDFFDDHASALYELVFSSQSIDEQAKYLSRSFSNYPFYPIKKVLNRLSGNNLYAYPNRLALAERFIKTYGLQWPSAQVSIGVVS